MRNEKKQSHMGTWEFNGKPWYKSWQPIVMLVIAFAESSFLYVQAAQTFSKQSAEDLSLVAFFILLITNIGWTLWGIFTRDIPVLTGGILQTLGSALVIGSIFAYGTEERPNVLNSADHVPNPEEISLRTPQRRKHQADYGKKRKRKKHKSDRKTPRSQRTT